MVKRGNKLGLGAYALPAFAFSFPLIPFAVFLPAFYAEDLGLGYATVGTALLLARIVDVLSDPIAGYLSDFRPIRGSFRKAWIAVGAVIAGIALVMVTRVEPGVSAFYLAAWSAVLYVGWTIVTVPYLSLGAELADGYDDKTRYTTAREAVSLVGMLAALSLPFLVAPGAPVIPEIPVYLIPAGLVCLAVFFLAVREKPLRHASADKFRLSHFRDVLLRTRFGRLGVVWLLTSTASAIPPVLFLIYVRDVLGGSDMEQGLALVIYFAAAVAGMPFWLWYAGGRLKHRVMAISTLIVCATFPIAAVLGDGQVAIFYGVCVVTGFALAAELSLAPSMLGDIAELDRRQTGETRTAIHFSLWGMVTKIALGLGTFAALGAMDMVASAVPTEAARAPYIAALYAGLPVVLKLPAALMLARFPFSVAERDLIRDQVRTDSQLT